MTILQSPFVNRVKSVPIRKRKTIYLLVLRIKMKFSLKSALVVITLTVCGLIFFVEPHLRIKRQNDVISVLTLDVDSIERENGNVTTIKCTFQAGGGDTFVPIPIERISALYKLKNLYFQSVSFDSLESIPTGNLVDQ